MGHSHGQQWNSEKIEQGILEVKQRAKINNMPTHSIIKEITGSYALTNAISRNGGTRYWADKLGLEIKPCESAMGYNYECECMNYLTEQGFYCEQTKAKYPYDLIVNGNIKVDVKCGHLYNAETADYYTFNLEKTNPTCDIFVCYCINHEAVAKVYIIPSCVLSGKTQLIIGKRSKVYDRYINNWHIFSRYNDFYEQIRKGVNK